MHHPTHTHSCGDLYHSCTQQCFRLENVSRRKKKTQVVHGFWFKQRELRGGKKNIVAQAPVFLLMHVVSHSNRQIGCCCCRLQRSSDGDFKKWYWHFNVNVYRRNQSIIGLFQFLVAYSSIHYIYNIWIAIKKITTNNNNLAYHHVLHLCSHPAMEDADHSVPPTRDLQDHTLLLQVRSVWCGTTLHPWSYMCEEKALTNKHQFFCSFYLSYLNWGSCKISSICHTMRFTDINYHFFIQRSKTINIKYTYALGQL